MINNIGLPGLVFLLSLFGGDPISAGIGMSIVSLDAAYVASLGRY